MPTVLLAIDARTPLERMLPAALLLAAEQHADVLGVFAQDERMLHGAALPFTIEVGDSSAACYPLSAESLHKRLQTIREHMRRSLAAAAERLHLHWEFQTFVGSISQITSEATAEVVVPGWSGNLSLSAAHVIAGRIFPQRQVIVTIDDGTPSAAHVMQSARQILHMTQPSQLVVFRTGDGPSDQPVSRSSLLGNSEESAIRVRSVLDLVHHLRLLQPTVVLLSRDQHLAADANFQRELIRIACPLALFRTRSA